MASTAGAPVNETIVIDAIPSTENDPSSKTAGTSVINSAAKPSIVVKPAIVTGTSMCRRHASAAASRFAAPAASSW